MSGSTIGGFVGGVFGFFIGGPAGAQIGFTIGSLVGGYVDPEQIIGPRLTDARTQTSQVGIPIPFGYGTFATAGNIIWAASYDGQPLREVRREESAKGGPEQVTFSYYRSYAIGICQGPMAGVLQIKRNGKVVYDARTDAEIELQLSGTPAEQIGQIIANIRANNAKFINRATIYLGDETQVADSLIESFEGVGEVSAFRGLAYMVVEEDDLTQLSGAIPQYEFVVAMAGVGTTTAGDALAPGRVAAFINADWPLAETVDKYKFTGYLGTTLPNVLTYTADSPQEIIDYFTAYDYSAQGGGSRAPSVYLGYSSYFGTSTVPDVGLNITAEGVSNAAPQADVEQAEALVLVYNDLQPDSIHGTLGFTGFCSSGSSVEQSLSGVVARLYPTDPGGQLRLFENCPGSTDLRGTYPLCIRVTRKRVGPLSLSEDDDYAQVPDAPGYYVGADGALVYDQTFSEVAGTYRVLATSATDSGQYTRYEVGPALAPSDPDYSDESFWTAAYNAAVAAGELPAGWGFSTSPSPSSYPITVTSVWQADGIPQEQLALDQVVLGGIVADLLQREGLTADDYEVSELTDLVDGYGPLATEAGADSFIAPLTQAYFFDPGEWDGKLRFIKRGGDVAYSLGPDDLAERDGDSIEQRRVQEAELLRKVNVAYRDPAGGYGIQTQTWERRASTVEAKGEKTVEVNIVTDADTAARIAAKRGKVAWSETEEFKFSLPYGVGAKCTPTDVVSLTDKAGKVHRVRLMNVEEDSGVIEVEAVKDVQAAYTSNVSGVAPAPPSITTPGLIGPTTLEVMNLPVLRDQDDELGVYVAVRGVLGGWRGAQVQISIDGGASVYTTVEKPEPSVIGYTMTDLGGWVSAEYPSPSSITVYLPEAPESVSYEALLQYNNRAAIQLDSGAWAVLQYQTVVANGDNSYTLSGLVLGRYATATGPATAGAAFVLLDSSVTFVQAQTWMLGQTLSVRAISYGTSADGIAWESFDFTTAASQTEWPVHMVAAERDAGTDDVTVTWIGRARLGGETAPRHSKYFAGYRVAWDDGSTITTADTTDSTYTIPAAADPIDVTVIPLNTITGEGPASEAVTV